MMYSKNKTCNVQQNRKVCHVQQNEYVMLKNKKNVKYLQKASLIWTWHLLN